MSKIQMVSGSDVRQNVQPLASQDKVNPAVGGSIESVRREVDDAYADMRTFSEREPDEIMRLVSGWSARFSELRVRIRRIEDLSREWRAVREREIEPTLEELQQQYTIASRMLSVREFDYRMSMGQP